jgi:predicted DNA-binding transcriptional regulator AlpA
VPEEPRARRLKDLRAESVAFSKRLESITNQLQALKPEALQLMTRHLQAVKESSNDFTDPGWSDREQTFFEESGFSEIADAFAELRNVVTSFDEQAPEQRVEIELCTTEEVAILLGLANRRGVHVYRRRYASFPQPFLEKGRRLLWRKRDIEAWTRESGRTSHVAPRRKSQKDELESD